MAPAATLAGALAMALAAAFVTSARPEPTLVDGALPLVAAAVWWLTAHGPGWGARNGLLLLSPLLLAVALLIPDPPARLLGYGLVFGAACVLALGELTIRDRARPVVEAVTAFCVVAPLRLIDPSPKNLFVQLVFIAGSIVLWRAIREVVRVEKAAAVVMLCAVTIPVTPSRLALVPWVLGLAVVALRRRSATIAAVIAISSLLVARWLGAALVAGLAGMVAARWIGRPGGAPLVMPPIAASAAAIPGVLAPLVWFPDLSRLAALAPVLGTTLLALLVRPSLAAPITLVGLTVATAGRLERGSPTFGGILPGLALTGLIAVFFPWSGAITARPPAPVQLFVVLAIAAMALLPRLLGAWSAFPAALLALAAFVQIPGSTELQLVGKQAGPGESITIEIAPGHGDSVEILLAGVSVESSRVGSSVATVEVLDADGRGFRRMVEIGEIADWGAFRPQLVLRTMNPRPDLPVTFEGHGIASAVSGTSSVRVRTPSEPRWVVVTAAPELESHQGVVVEAVRYDR